MKSRAYRATNVKDLDVSRWLPGRLGQPADFGLDLSKGQIRGVLRWNDRSFERPLRADNPGQIPPLVALLLLLHQSLKLRIALEPTGTYGDPLRQALDDAGLLVHRVSPKASHDYAEVFDGVPSQHDGKDAAVVAELLALGKATVWPFHCTVQDQELAYWVDRLEAQRRVVLVWSGRLEGLLARHWPEATAVLGLRSGVLLRCLERYGGPAGLAADDQALRRLRNWGGPLLAPQKAQALLASASASLGVRQGDYDVLRLKEYAQALRQARQQMSVCRRRLEELAQLNEVLLAQAQAVGAATACVLWACVGDPRDYSSGGAYRKAMGLNLTERSSGRWQGRIHISGRGSQQARRWLYYAALRISRQEGVQEWFVDKKERDGGLAGRALVGLMRKLALALYRVGACGEVFEAARLFGQRQGQGVG
jgi:transposase